MANEFKSMNERILLAAFKCLESVAGRTKIQKLMFLLWQEFGINTYHFELHYYGPYSQELSDDLEALQGRHVLTETKSSTQNGRLYSEFKVTAEESPLCERAYVSLPPAIRDKIQDACARYRSYTPTEIMHYVYKQYPKWKPV